ncbi:unknown [Lachnospiraceae bacterium CAG:215]|nr:unknown [Lachnospiraceae bacterium CAG:215]
MAGNPFHVDADFHTSSLSAVDSAVSRFCGYDKFRTDFIFIDDVLPAETVTVFFLYGSDYHDLASLRDQIQVFHDLSAVYGRYDTAALVGYTTSADLGLCLISLIWIKCPVLDISDTYGVDMCIVCDDLFSGSHVTDDISLWVDDYFIKSDFFHLGSDRVDVGFLITAFARVFYDRTKKCGHVFFVSLCSLFDFVQIHFLISFSFLCKVYRLHFISVPDDGFVTIRIRISLGGEEQDFGILIQSEMFS